MAVIASPGARAAERTRKMRVFKAGRPVMGGTLAATWSKISAVALASVVAAVPLTIGANMTGAIAAETIMKFSLDFKFEGPSAPFLLPLDKGYYKAEGLNVTIDSASGSLEPITRVASGTYDMVGTPKIKLFYQLTFFLGQCLRYRPIMFTLMHQKKVTWSLVSLLTEKTHKNLSLWVQYQTFL